MAAAGIASKLLPRIGGTVAMWPLGRRRSMAVDRNGKKLPAGIRQRENGRYEGRVKHEYRSYSVYADTIKETKRLMNELRYKLEHNSIVPERKVTMDAWFDTWIAQYKAGRVKEGTVIAYRNYYKFYVQSEIGSRKIADIRGEHIQRLYNSLNSKDIAVSSLKIIAAVLNGCFKQALKNGLIERNPAALATLPQDKEKHQRRVFTVEEQQLFMEYAEGSYLYNLFALALRSGMRSGEIRGLKYSDIDRRGMVIHVRRTLKYETKRGFFEDTPKTRTSCRDIPLTKDMADIIERQMKAVTQDGITRLDGYIFHTDADGPISRERLQGEINRIISRAKDDGKEIEYFTPHCFRHTFATRAIENGMQPQTLKSILGHSTLSMTMDLYSHVLPSTKADEMQKIAGAF